MNQRTNVAGRQLPLVVQLGFAGSRALYDPGAHPEVESLAFQAGVEAYLTERIRRLPKLLGFAEPHFLCGISQLAAGGDMLFTRACKALDIPQRIFLPEHRDEFLRAVGNKNVPDFSEAEQAEAVALLSSAHVIQERTASESDDREARFAEVNREIARVSDVLVCLVREGARAKPGSTQDLINRGRQRNLPVLEIRVAVKDGCPEFSDVWHGRSDFLEPILPGTFAAARLADSETPPAHTPIDVCCQALLDLGDAQANWQRKLFKAVAGIIIGTHVLATILAVIVLALHGSAPKPQGEHESAAGGIEHAVVLCLLSFELISLAVGFGVHQYLHHSHACHRWALSRLVAEVARSVMAFGSVHVYLEHLFALPFPSGLRPLLRTINVLHLRSARNDATAWKVKRKNYVEMRLTSPDGQIKYYGEAAARARRWLRGYHRTFLLCSGGAFLATFTKLLITSKYPQLHMHAVTGTLGGLAIALPVLAVAALSLAAAMDLEARKHTYVEMLGFLKDQVDRLNGAATEPDFRRLLLETESRLLGETANWYSRRAFTGVA